MLDQGSNRGLDFLRIFRDTLIPKLQMIAEAIRLQKIDRDLTPLEQGDLLGLEPAN